MTLGPVDIRQHYNAARRTQDWVHGFGQALRHCAHLTAVFDETVRTALHGIAAHAVGSSETNRTSGNTKFSIQQAVLVLAQSRTSRGPLSDPDDSKRK